MELLSYLGQATKRKKRFEERAADLAAQFPGVEVFEEEMSNRSEGLVYRLANDRMRFTEFKRVAADDTIVSALTGIMLGDEKAASKDRAFAASTKALPYMWRFFNDIQYALDSGRISKTSDAEAPVSSVQSLTKYARTSINPDDDLAQDMLDQISRSELYESGNVGKSIPATWDGVQSRLDRYLVTPVYGWYSYGEQDKNRRLGFKEMRRDATLDKSTCPDCRSWDAMGWRPIGELPMPGVRCQCLDGCRCRMLYR